ncbi:MAG: esterase, partial [Bacteroidaceae bacterium]|nr:esterase [Bacteroidaceae bacterium]
MTIPSMGFAQEALFNANDINSPEINADGTVTFRLYAPKAVTVQVTGDFLPKVKTTSPFGEVESAGIADMKEEKGGIWTFTTGSLDPELYSYKFVVDGNERLDPSNVYMCRDIASYTNIFIVKKANGDKGDLYSVNEVPHGNVAKVWYDSPTLKTKRRMTVYTPAGYEDSKEKLPVMYLLHGAGGDEDAWPTLGRAAQIMDNLIATGKAKPMIVVMTNGNANCQAAPGEWSAGMYKPSFMGHTTGEKPASTMQESFPDVIKYVESHYRTLPGKKNRAICGLSMGGGHSFMISRNFPDTFDYVGLFSAAIQLNQKKAELTMENGEVDDLTAQQLKSLFAKNPKLYWIAIGNTDFLYKA